jgi:hypothetical protein
LRGFLSGPRLPTLGLPLIAATIDTYSLVTPVLQHNAAKKWTMFTERMLLNCYYRLKFVSKLWVK